MSLIFNVLSRLDLLCLTRPTARLAKNKSATIFDGVKNNRGTTYLFKI